MLGFQSSTSSEHYVYFQYTSCVQEVFLCISESVVNISSGENKQITMTYFNPFRDNVPIYFNALQYSIAFTSILPEIIIKTFGFLLILGEIELMKSFEINGNIDTK